MGDRLRRSNSRLLAAELRVLERGNRPGECWAGLKSARVLDETKGSWLTDWQHRLERDPRCPFRDWERIKASVPTKPGVYTVWDQNERFLLRRNRGRPVWADLVKDTSATIWRSDT